MNLTGTEKEDPLVVNVKGTVGMAFAAQQDGRVIALDADEAVEGRDKHCGVSAVPVNACPVSFAIAVNP